MNGKFQKIGNRTLVGAGIVAAIGLSIELGAWAVFVLFGVVAAIGLYEVARIFAGGGRAVNRRLIYSLGGVLYYGIGVALAGASGKGVWAGCLGVGAVVTVLTAVWPGRRPQANPQTEGSPLSASAIAWSVWAAVYVAVPLALLVGLQRAGLIWPLFIVVWVNDIFAYLVGSSFKAEKRHKLAPRISPNKSWEGAAGGFLAALAAGWGWAVWQQRPLSLMLGFAALVSVVSVLGDLLESHYKRRAGLKDSGALLGGHGGILDRFDSVLLAAPAAALLWVAEQLWKGI